MLFEPTTLAATAQALAEAIQPYGCDAETLFRRAGLDIKAVRESGARYPFRSMTRLWTEARVETGDPCIGLFAGQKLRPPGLHALGLSWLSSTTLLDGLRRIERYVHVASTAIAFEIRETEDQVQLVLTGSAEALQPAPEAVDACFAVVVKMCRTMADSNFAPLTVALVHPDHGHIGQYIDFFRAPVKFAADENVLQFDLETLQKPLPAGNRELAYANDRIAAGYLATLNPDQVQDKVREILVGLLSSGNASQQEVAKTLHRSVSSLQRQLKAEGVSYRDILEDTRYALAQQFVREQRYSLSQIAYLLGFSDQANFSRAFKRWTGNTPSAYRQRAS